MTRTEFENWYAEQSKLPLENLRDLGRPAPS